MRILTPAEVRQVEKERRDIINIGVYTGNHTVRMAITITPKNYELWLNILDLALQQSESLKEAWRKDKAPNLTDEVCNKLRPKP